MARDFCCDPFKSHTRRIYSYLRVVPSAIITEHHSLCIRSGDLACCNCLRKIRKLNPEIALVDTSSGSSLTQAVWVLVTQVPNTVLGPVPCWELELLGPTMLV